MSDDLILHLFAGLFKGREDAWGSVEGKSNKETVTIENYRLHLAGKKSLGVYPLLDSGECHFAAVDLDEKNWDKALLIRNELGAIGINAYIAESKGKGYHIYMFGDPIFIVKDIRYVLICLLEKLDITAEVFPKQDKLDEVITLGNYINLPCFGDTRKFQTGDKVPVDKEQALALIKKNLPAAVTSAKDKVPPLPPLMMPVKPRKENDKSDKKGKSKSPPCVLTLLRGVDSGMRDEAAFALARHYLDQGNVPEEVLAKLLIWDAKNKPPLGDMRILQTKVQSAEHGYAFGCNSITSGLLSGACIGKTRCQWLTEVIKEKKRTGEIVETSHIENGDMIYEEVVRNADSPALAECVFMAYDCKTKQTSEVKEVQVGEVTYVPTYGGEIKEGLVIFPTGLEEYGSTTDLVKEIVGHIYHYADFSTMFMEWTAWYVLMTWVYDRMPAVVYLRFLGDFGTGKSRTLDVIGGISYKRTKVTGAITPAPIFRLIDKYRGSLIIDENDMDKSDESQILVKILNSGIERGSPIVRCVKDDPNTMQTFCVFGPKLFGTRRRFDDNALESRCLTTIMEETDRPIGGDAPDALAPFYDSIECQEARAHLRNKLLLFRFRHLSAVPKVMSEKVDIDLGNISGRLKQVCLPFATIFKDNPETMDKFKRFLINYQAELRGENSDSFQGRIVSALFKTALAMGKHTVTAQAIANTAKEENNMDISTIKVSKLLKNMKIKINQPKRVGNKSYRYVQWDDTLMRKIYSRYQSGEPEALDLLGIETMSVPPKETTEADAQGRIPEQFK
jgi:hypothetical protein